MAAHRSTGIVFARTVSLGTFATSHHESPLSSAGAILRAPGATVDARTETKAQSKRGFAGSKDCAAASSAFLSSLLKSFS